MLRPDWHKSVQATDWRELIDDKQVLVADVYITLANPKPHGKERPVSRFSYVAKVPKGASDDFKARAIKTTTNMFIDNFDKLYEAQNNFEITEKTKPI